MAKIIEAPAVQTIQKTGKKLKFALLVNYTLSAVLIVILIGRLADERPAEGVIALIAANIAAWFVIKALIWWHHK